MSTLDSVISLSATRNNSIGSLVESLGSMLTLINSKDSSIGCKVDCQNFKYSPPLLSVVTASQINEKKFSVDKDTTSSYLDTIKYPEGKEYCSEEELKSDLESYQNKSYLPLIKFPTGSDTTTSQSRNNIISHVSKMIRKIAQLPVGYYTGIDYMITEMVDNIVEHSNTESGLISFQYYRDAGFIDICLSDSGKGVLQSYKDYEGEADYSEITTHLDALEGAFAGKSTKSKLRGFGVHTSRRMLVDGLAGTLIYSSGNGMVVNYDLLPANYNYKGVFFFIRIPCGTIIEDFNYIDHIN